MKLINDTRDDFSTEYYAILGAILSMVYAADIAATRLIATEVMHKVKGSLIQEKKRYLAAAVKGAEMMEKNLALAFDDTFDQIIMDGGPEKAGERDNTLHGMAAEVLKLVLMYMAKSNGMDHDKRQNIFKMLGNFKDDGKVDLPAILKFFRYE